MALDLEPLRAGVAMTWQALDERERMIVLYTLAWLVFGFVAAYRRRDRERLKAEIREELAGAGQGSR